MRALPTLRTTLASLILVAAAAAPSWSEEPQSVYSDSVADAVCRTRCQQANDAAQCLATCLGNARSQPVAAPTQTAVVPPPDADTLRALAEARTPPATIAYNEQPPAWAGPQAWQPFEAVDPPPLFIPLRVYHRRSRHVRRPIHPTRPPATSNAPTTH